MSLIAATVHASEIKRSLPLSLRINFIAATTKASATRETKSVRNRMSSADVSCDETDRGQNKHQAGNNSYQSERSDRKGSQLPLAPAKTIKYRSYRVDDREINKNKQRGYQQL